MLEFWNDWWWAICLFILVIGGGGVSLSAKVSRPISRNQPRRIARAL